MPVAFCVTAVNVVDVVFTGIVIGVVCKLNTDGAVDIAFTAVATAIRSLLVVRTVNVNVFASDDTVYLVARSGCGLVMSDPWKVRSVSYSACTARLGAGRALSGSATSLFA